MVDPSSTNVTGLAGLQHQGLKASIIENLKL
jgi:hypothetical protein